MVVAPIRAGQPGKLLLVAADKLVDAGFGSGIPRLRHISLH